MSSPSSPNLSHGSGTMGSAKERSCSTSAVNVPPKAQRGGRRSSILPLCMSRDQHAALQTSSASSQSAGKHRKQRGSSGPAGKPRQQTPLAGSPTKTTAAANNANGWMALLAHPETSQEIARALQMCSLYPTLRVAGTAFENSLNVAHRMNADTYAMLCSSRRGTDLNNVSFSDSHRDDVPHSPRMSISVLMETSSMLREAADDWRTSHDGSGSGGGGGRNSVLASNSAAADAVSRAIALSGGTKMVQMACAMKRAAMWEVLVVTALAHRVMELKFRRDRLRCVLERHLLPTLMRRKTATGSVIVQKDDRMARRGNKDVSDDPANAGALAGLDSSGAPQGTYLRDHDPFFASLNNSSLLQSFAETMTRHRFLPGEVIARAGQPSQKAKYFLISGKCEVTKGRSESSTDAAELSASGSATNAAPNTPTYRDGMHSTKAPRSRPSGRPDSSVLRYMKEVIMPGSSFGGIFGGGSSAVFAETYRALSYCIVWELSAEEFEQVFRPFSDRGMVDKYKESLRAHSLAWLQQHYHPSKVFSSIPVYRKLASRKSRYLNDFTPAVKVRGELLFAQDDLPGDVYCLLEGTVLRRTKGTATEDGVAQRIATNAFSALHSVGRCLLLGEEPHLLPGVQPYTCTVSSRVALFYKISGESLVSALLDDPAFFAQLRERLVKQRQANMVLHPDCLAYVPLLQRFPPEKRAELVQSACPRVVGRSTSLCEPAQHLSELMLVVSGGVCDPRHYGQRPTTSLPVPASGETDDAGGVDGSPNGSSTRQVNGLSHNKSSKTDRRRREPDGMSPNGASEQDLSYTAAAAKRHTLMGNNGARFAGKNGVKSLDREDSGDEETNPLSPDAVGFDWNFSIADTTLSSTIGGHTVSNTSFNSTGTGGEAGGLAKSPRAHAAPQMTAAQLHQKLCQTAPIVCPDESEEINPPLPSQPSRSFLYALGGSWEALLLEKWPNGWETTSTVALWAIPTHKLRLVYNSCVKATQSYILNGLRLAQKEDQQLPSIPHTKMPPMTVYTQRGEAVVAGAVETNSQSTGKSSVQRRHAKRKQPEQPPQPQQQQQQNQQRSPAGLLTFAIPSDATASFLKADDVVMSTSATGAEEQDPLGGWKRSQRPAKDSRGESGGSSNINAVVTPPGAGAKARAMAVPGAVARDTNARKPQLPPHGALRDAAATTPSATASKSKSTAGRKTNSVPRKEEEDDSAHVRAAGYGKTSAGGHAVSRRRVARQVAVSAPSTPIKVTIDPAVKAAYDGVLDATNPLMLRIVRDPVVAPAAGSSNINKPSAKRAAALAGRNLPPLQSDLVAPSPEAVTTVNTTGASSAAWPAHAPVHERWFQAVPSYEPLPGTVRAAETLAAPPVFAPNSTVLALTGTGSSSAHAKMLESHVAYYAASVSPGVASTRKRGDVAGDVPGGVSPHPLPKRRAYAA
ncbi:hypothetical protein ABB37_04372 [Leptomonas pyrrhocoris]|uniref:Cyclic nucleotide-binding domain-containing protein n=1 Tax=Leptomonas pyrrhocoris TaxID=157538 RepID=A0A0M9G2S5_LEPPY|nr:hypothetical protein ABB37_04372 [Leptomonas pyrrhocoris]XP_015659428.1 hypothetical protein ABB37_04372 [Leptomonas pyrrhocoris]KPA80988.1 hypothetical protein ABB37_04372 [Leptomonas pyrrhocoris]KPA80989.1 hypothetical protein ABB37_04372 [Leptomonas pyrrhocoris]|eukprot:XP_015659427.1 hypothetical protein ABB37_04372 [Leptomonas pyrrhocoris]